MRRRLAREVAALRQEGAEEDAQRALLLSLLVDAGALMLVLDVGPVFLRSVWFLLVVGANLWAFARGGALRVLAAEAQEEAASARLEAAEARRMAEAQRAPCACANMTDTQRESVRLMLCNEIVIRRVVEDEGGEEEGE